MSSCQRCGESLHLDSVQVSCYGSCKGVYHLECTSLSTRTFRQRTEEQKKSWICETCRPGKGKKKGTKEYDSDYTHKNATENANSSDADDEDRTAEKRKNSPKKSAIERKLDLLLRGHEALLKGQERANYLMEEMKNTIDFLKRENLKKDKIIAEMQDEMHEAQQYNRKSFFEIHNLPWLNGEEKDTRILEKSVVKIAELSGVQLEADEIEAYHRIPTRNKSKVSPVIVQLASRKKREAIMAGKPKEMCQDDILSNGSTYRVYVNESLTKYHKELFYDAKKIAYELDYDYTWCKDGKIFMRMEDGMRSVRIRNYADLENLPPRTAPRRFQPRKRSTTSANFTRNQSVSSSYISNRNMVFPNVPADFSRNQSTNNVSDNILEVLDENAEAEDRIVDSPQQQGSRSTKADVVDALFIPESANVN